MGILKQTKERPKLLKDTLDSSLEGDQINKLAAVLNISKEIFLMSLLENVRD